MYLNLKIFQSSGLEAKDVVILTAVKQNKAGVNEDIILEVSEEGDLERLQELSLIEPRKTGKKGDSLAKRSMLTKKGSDLLLSLVQSSAGEDEEMLINWVIDIYKKRGGVLSNRKESLRRLTWFSDITGLKKNDLALTVKAFMDDTFVHDPKEGEFFECFNRFKEDNPKAVLAQKVDNLFYKPEGMFDTKPSSYNLEKSPLYKHWKNLN